MDKKRPPESAFHVRQGTSVPSLVPSLATEYVNMEPPVTLQPGCYLLSVENREFIRLDEETFEPVESIKFTGWEG
jgi:hypothetical protein